MLACLLAGLDTLRNMLQDHLDYYSWSYRYIQYLHDICSIHDVALPRPPSKCVESYGLFEHKLKNYPNKMLPDQRYIAWEIDYIVDKWVDEEGYACFEIAWKGYHSTDTRYADTFITEDNMDVAERFYKLYPKMRLVKGTKTRTRDDDSSSDDDDGKENETVVYIDEATAAHKVKLLEKSVHQPTTIPKKPKTKPNKKRKLSKPNGTSSSQPLSKQAKPTPSIVHPPSFTAVPAASINSFHSAPAAISAMPLLSHPLASHPHPQPPQWTPASARTFQPVARSSVVEIIDVQQAAPTQSNKTLFLSS